MADSHSPWLAFINPDLMIEADTLTELRSRGEVLGDCLLGVEQVDEHGHADEAVRRRDPDFLLMLRSPGKGSKLAVPRDPHQAVQPVPALSGALLMMPRTLFERIGGWDAGYRLHAEDLDLCRRAREAGAVVAIANDLQVTHVRGVSSRSRPFFVEWHKHRGCGATSRSSRRSSGRCRYALRCGPRSGRMRRCWCRGCCAGRCSAAGASTYGVDLPMLFPVSRAWPQAPRFTPPGA